MKIGIMGAMIEEVSSIKNAMTIYKKTEIADRLYYEGTLGGIEAVLSFSRWGKVASSSTATTMINVFGVQSIFFTGVAGAVSDHLNIGDVVIASALYQHDMDARPLYQQFQIPLIEKIFFEPSAESVNRAKKAVGSFLKKISTLINDELLSKYSIETPSFYTGIIASGDKFITCAKKNNDLALKDEHVLAVEMEGAAVAQVCYEHKIPYTIIRIISDKANHSAAIDFQSFIADIASAYSAGIISEYVSSTVDD